MTGRAPSASAASSYGDRLPLSVLAAYALPGIPLAALTLPLYVLVPTFYTETLGLSLATVGYILLLTRMFDALNDPLVGWFADHFRPRFGRRRALFAFSLPLTAIAGFMLFWPPQDAGAFYLLGWGMTLSLGYTASLIPLTAWGAELSTTYRGRSRLAGWREGFILTGTLIAIALPFSIGFSSSEGVHGLAALAIAIALTLPLFGAITVIFVPEPVEHTRQRVALRAGLVHIADNRPFVRLIAAYFVNGLANGIPATLFLYFVSERLALPEARGPLLFIYFLSGIAGVPLALRLADRIGKHRAWCYAMLTNCAFFVAAPLLPEGALYLFGAMCVATGLFLGFDLSLPASIQADVVDVDTAASGEQRSGIYFAAWSLTTKLSLAVGAGLIFPALALFGFDPQSSSQEGSALLALALLYAWVPIALKLVAVAIMWNFPLDEAEHGRLRSSIEADPQINRAADSASPSRG
ncbi:MFS transporter [Pararhizobium haloflavum]|uniref:MFS transporter n=1 Tax=Pararhizobium haloflavum TaxID=2037914 RepID=UPI0018E4AB3B|nr:MFS transporter [Pararhizobium haloflavum]